jgi:hypothetical protein
MKALKFNDGGKKHGSMVRQIRAREQKDAYNSGGMIQAK